MQGASNPRTIKYSLLSKPFINILSLMEIFQYICKCEKSTSHEACFLQELVLGYAHGLIYPLPSKVWADSFHGTSQVCKRDTNAQLYKYPELDDE